MATAIVPRIMVPGQQKACTYLTGEFRLAVREHWQNKVKVSELCIQLLLNTLTFPLFGDKVQSKLTLYELMGTAGSMGLLLGEARNPGSFCDNLEEMVAKAKQPQP